MIAVAIESARTAWVRGLLMGAMAIGLVIAALPPPTPNNWCLFSDARGRARLAELLQAGSPLAMTLPGFTTEDWVTALSDLWPWLAPVLAGAVRSWFLAPAAARRRTVCRF